MNKTSSWPNWLNEFADALQFNEKRAENNVLDLPTVNWQDETFYVKFNERGATLYNKFATVVKEIDGVKDMAGVDSFLNEDSVVASKETNDVVEDERIEENLEKEIQTTDDVVEDAINDDTEVTTMQEIVSEDVPLEDNALTKELEDIMNVPEDQEQEIENKSDIEILKEEVAELRNLVNQLLEKNKTFDENNEKIVVSNDDCEDCDEEECESNNGLEKRVASLETKLAEMIHAYEVIENDRYDLKSEEQEMNHVQKNKELSEKILRKEHELDISRQEERSKLDANFLDDILSDFESNPVNEAVQEIVENEEPIEESEMENNLIDGNVQMVDSIAPIEAANEESEENLDDFDEEISDEELIEIYNNLTPEQVVKVEAITEDDEPADVYFPVTGLENDTDETVVNLLKERGVLDADYFVLLNGNVEEVYPATKEQFVEFLRNSNLLEVAEEPTEDSVEENINEEV